MVYVPDTTGHLDTLTATQDAKLRELWTLLFTSIASILASVYEVDLPNGPPGQIFEALERVQEPTVEAVIAAIKSIDSPSTATTATTAPLEPSSVSSAPVTVDDTIRTELAHRKVSPSNFSTIFSRLRQLGITDVEIRAMTEILSTLTAEEMCFAILKMIKQEHPDSLLLRFLRARKWDGGQAFAMLTSNILWRKQSRLDDDVLPHGELYAWEKARDEKSSTAERKEGEDFVNQLKMGKSFLHGFDRTGRPVNYVRVKIHKPGAQSEETLERFIMHVIESTRLIVVPPVETGTIVFDMTGFSLSNMEYQPVKFIIKCFEANYPESLGTLLIHNAPWVFSGIWKLIHAWMDPVVASKVHFTKSIKDLDQFIPREQIPKELGGDEDWKYEYQEPKPNENEVMRDTATRDALMYERLSLAVKMLGATGAWVSAASKPSAGIEDADMTTIKARREEAIAKLTENYWKLDPYIRSRALIDRIGILKPGGVVVRDRMTNGAAE